MAKHTLLNECRVDDPTDIDNRKCVNCKEPWPCTKLTEHNKELMFRFWKERKAPVRLEHGRHSTAGPRDWKS